MGPYSIVESYKLVFEMVPYILPRGSSETYSRTCRRYKWSDIEVVSEKRKSKFKLKRQP